MRRKNMQCAAFMVMAMVAMGCGPSEENSSVASIGQALTPDVPIWYNGNTAAQYAHDHAFKIDGPKPFRLWAGNNCVNFASQSILAGLSGKTNPTDLMKIVDDYDYDARSAKADEFKWYYNSVSGEGKAWISTTKLWAYANHSWSETWGLRFNYITHSTTANPEGLNADKVQRGDIVFGDWFGDDGSFNHTMVVVWVDPDTSKKALDRIHVASQTDNTDDWTLRDGFYTWAKGKYGGTPVFHIHRPLYFISR